MARQKESPKEEKKEEVKPAVILNDFNFEPKDTICSSNPALSMVEWVSTYKNPRATKRKVNTCGHPEKKHYAKGMCSICYHKAGRTKLAWNCKHKDKRNYAKGCCQTCYLSLYYNEKKERPSEKLTKD